VHIFHDNLAVAGQCNLVGIDLSSSVNKLHVLE